MIPTSETLSVDETLDLLDRTAPGVPLLALGQTVFWDEPMKAGLARALNKRGNGRQFVAGVHDTDYFAKSPGGQRMPGRFRALPHNDTTTKGFWSAAGEFSALFGSETVVTKETLAHAGLRIDKLERGRPGFLDEATEAFGWRGVASMDEHPPITADVPLRRVWNELEATLEWAISATLDCLTGEGKEEAEREAEELRTLLCDASEDRGVSLGDCYRRMLPLMLRFCGAGDIEVLGAATTELLRFNVETCSLPRFQLVASFVEERTRLEATQAYDSAIEGSGLYPVAKFGTGAIPFDLVVPGVGRGTVRLGRRGAVIETPEPLFLSYKCAPASLEEFAKAVETKFGSECALVGKAVPLLGMLGAEYVFVFHEGASGYAKVAQAFFSNLKASCGSPALYPILRVRYETWDAMQTSCAWLRLPEPLQQPFGAEDICAPSFAKRWRAVADEQEALLEKLAELRKPIGLIRFLDESLGGAWNQLAAEYEDIHTRLLSMEAKVAGVRQERHKLLQTMKVLRAERVAAEGAKGEHFRERIFEKPAEAQDLAERERLSQEVEQAIHRVAECRGAIAELMERQRALVSGPEIRADHDRRRTLEVEAELRRLKLIRDAVVASKGLRRANHRPSAWWFPLVSPDGLWFRETTESARCYLEPLLP